MDNKKIVETIFQGVFDTEDGNYRFVEQSDGTFYVFENVGSHYLFHRHVPSIQIFLENIDFFREMKERS